jgi:transketolase
MIHCHDDKQFVILDQIKFLSHIYTHIKDWRTSTIEDRRKNLTWRKDLFYVERPFRSTNNEQMKKKKKKKNMVWRNSLKQLKINTLRDQTRIDV